MKHRARVVLAIVVALFLLAIPMASAGTGDVKVPVKRYGICLSVSPQLTVCY
jgi:hypothetical protein